MEVNPVPVKTAIKLSPEQVKFLLGIKSGSVLTSISPNTISVAKSSSSVAIVPPKNNSVQKPMVPPSPNTISVAKSTSSSVAIVRPKNNSVQKPMVPPKNTILVSKSNSPTVPLESLPPQTTANTAISISTNDIEENENSPPQTQDGNGKWSTDETSRLINLYKDFQSKFKSTTIRNEQVWNKISENFRFSSDQVQRRWKYLKAKYMKKKDNGGEKSSGSEVVHFPYFEEMDLILRKESNVQPVALAGNLRAISNTVTEEHILEDSDEMDTPASRATPSRNNKKRKLNVLDQLKIMETRRHNRHIENMQKKDRLLNILNDISQSLKSN